VKLGMSAAELARASIGGAGWRRFLDRFDWVLFATMAALVATGLVNLYSATFRTAHSGKFESQLVWIAIGMAGFFLFAAIDYRSLHRLAWLLLGGAIAATAVVRLLSDPIKGSQRWLDVVGFHIQPSEITKVIVILGLARLLHDRAREELSRPQLVIGTIALGVPVLFIAIQPDLGTSILLALIIASVSALLAVRLWPRR